MKIVFCGPTLPVLSTRDGRRRFPSLTVWPPARQGDVLRALKAGAKAIGIIDGVFEQVPAVWHKEILHALHAGIPVFGAASMGALRAAECAAFGMVPVGKIAEDYCNGTRMDDADVAQLHGPEALGYPALSEPLVTVQAVLEGAVTEGVIRVMDGERLANLASGMFFKDRTWPALLDAAGLSLSAQESTGLMDLVRRINPKRDDAWLLAEMMESLQAPEIAPGVPWTLQESRQLREQLKRLCYS